MVAFSGADDADTCSSWRPASRRKHYVKALEAPYPGIDKQIVGFELINWPRDKWSMGSYYFSAQG